MTSSRLPAVCGEGRTWKRGRLPGALAWPVHAARDARNVDVQRWRTHRQGILAAGWDRRGRELDPGRPGDRECRGCGCGGRVLPPVPAGGCVRRCARAATYLGTVTPADGTALVDLVLDRNPFMLANGPRRAARPHALMVPRRHRDGWSSATAPELAGRQTAMTLVAEWYRSLDGGYVVFCANDSAPNLDYLRDLDAASAAPAGRGTGAAITRNPRQDVQHAHLHAFYAEHDRTENHESSALAGHRILATGYRAFSAALGSGAVQVEPDSTSLAASLRAVSQRWGGNYCSYQLGIDGPLWVMPALGPSQDEVNRRLARADGLQAQPDPELGGAINVARPSLADTRRLHAAQRATADQRASFETFVARLGLNAKSLAAGRAPG